MLIIAYNVKTMMCMKNVPKLNFNVKSVIKKQIVKKINMSAHNVNMLCMNNALIIVLILYAMNAKKMAYIKKEHIFAKYVIMLHI